MKALNQLFGIALISIIVVGLGITMAMWSETLKVNVYVNTGEVKVKWSEWYCSDTGPDPQAPGFNNTEGKDVAKCYVTVEQWAHDPPDPIKLNITLSNAYPGYAVNVTLVVDNIGSIPVKLYAVNYTHLEPQDLEALSIRLIPPSDTQIHPGGNSTYILEIIVLQAANETTTYSFDVEFTFAQWNEVP